MNTPPASTTHAPTPGSRGRCRPHRHPRLCEAFSSIVEAPASVDRIDHPAERRMTDVAREWVRESATSSPSSRRPCAGALSGFSGSLSPLCRHGRHRRSLGARGLRKVPPSRVSRPRNGRHQPRLRSHRLLLPGMVSGLAASRGARGARTRPRASTYHRSTDWGVETAPLTPLRLRYLVKRSQPCPLEPAVPRPYAPAPASLPPHSGDARGPLRTLGPLPAGGVRDARR